MANAMYGLGRKSFCDGDFALLTDNIKLLLINTSSYTVSINADQFKSDIAGGAITATSGNLASKSTTLGTFDAADVTFSAVSGSLSSALVLYKDTGTSSTSRLILYLDVATNLPVTPNGGDITVQWDNGTNKIFTLFEGIKPEDIRRYGWRPFHNMLDWLRGTGIPAERNDAGIWIPKPRVIQRPALVAT
jgi:hypothetical protein